MNWQARSRPIERNESAEKVFSLPSSLFLKGNKEEFKLNNSPESLFFKGKQGFFGTLETMKSTLQLNEM